MVHINVTTMNTCELQTDVHTDSQNEVKCTLNYRLTSNYLQLYFKHFLLPQNKDS
jgi:hypothetical protein